MNNNEEFSSEIITLSNTEAQDRALIDKQIATAKQFPRNIQKVRDNVVAIATMDIETAKTCGYALPRAGKNISGASVHLARIVAQQYGNIRVDSKIVDIDATHVTSQATCIDLENNVGIRIEVKRKIIDSKGKRYNEDMITMTGNAGSAIAFRNAVFATVPKPIIDAGYEAAQQKITGDISDENKLIAARKKTIDEFLKSFGVTEQEILTFMGLRETTQIKGEELRYLINLRQSLKDGDVTVDETFRKTDIKPIQTEITEQQIFSIEDHLEALKESKDKGVLKIKAEYKNYKTYQEGVSANNYLSGLKQ